METIPTRWLTPDQRTRDVPPLGEFLQVVGRQKWLILVCVLLTASAAILYAFGRSRLYEAEARILIDPRGMQVVDRDITPRNQTDGASSALVESQMRVITSGDVLAKVVATEGLATNKDFMKSGLISTMRSELSALLSGPSAPTPPDLVALAKLRDAVNTVRPKGSYIVEVFVRTKEPKMSAQLANAVAQTYVAYEANAHANLARQGSGALDERIRELRNQLSEAEQKVEAYKLENGILSTTGTLVNEQALTRLNELLVTARDRSAAAQSKYDQVKAIRDSGKIPETLPEAIDSTTIGNLRVNYARTQQEYQALSSRLLPNHPTMQTARVQLTSAKAAINAELSRVAESARGELDRQQAHVKDLEKQVETLRAEAFATNDKMVQLRDLTRDAEAKRAVYEAFLVRAKELGEQENVGTSNVRIISAATLPLRPVGPGSLLIVALGIVAGLGLGVLLAFARESFTERVRVSGRASS